MNQAERNRLVVDNLPLVGYLVAEVCAKASHLSRDDLASAGALALVTCAESYNPELGIPFGAFARRRIIGAFADEMRASDWATRSVRRRIKETLVVQEALTGALGRTPSVDEIAAALGVDRSVADEALTDAARSVTPLDHATTEYLAADVATPEGSVLDAERLGYLREAVAALPEKMRYIVEQIYFEDRTVKEIAAELGSTHSAVSQQRAEAIRLMQDGFSAHYSDEPGTDRAPQSRIAPLRRNAYLAAVAEHTLGGITRVVRAVEPVLNSAS
ncbi:sigma-70 family RNA polymerase sigma factor [Paenarthrobacter sp. DKR-5]|uniref:sigma-70 family RNA polymerase sigma factor n=1 Tax=Paenarthrobacter sp. DKR-5 TaxID=2835535 RepID=UPI001BDD67E9|nr:sigma-70 family RNA polymerase sigma factor [Paenarthrobacter sp. DKR-5]MBT1003777.1 sigma-70 family RNA polymerase sigma factor [Paenarthrobacter sp. DKR-5]